MDMNSDAAAPGGEGEPHLSDEMSAEEQEPTGGESSGAGGAGEEGDLSNAVDDADGEAGEITVKVVTNDGTPESMELLVGLKNIFAIQLPRMPRDYIVRLVFDRKHKSLALCRNGTPIAGICYRPHYTQGFGEIAFCAVQGQQQVRGYGTRIMNELKEHGKQEGLTSFLTYADGFALGYFRRLGFTRNPFVPRDRREPFIKQYEGAVYMECYVHPTVDYTRPREILKLQRDFLLQDVLERADGGPIFKKRKGLEFSDDDGEEKGPASVPKESPFKDIEKDIPGVAEAGWTNDAIAAERRKNRYAMAPEALEPFSEALYTELQNILEHLRAEEQAAKFSWPFLRPVKSEEVTDYYSLIKNPIDLETMGKRNDARYYRNVDMFRADLLRMAHNCMTYNGPLTEYYECGEQLKAFALQRLPPTKGLVVPEVEKRRTTTRESE